ncbi:CDP-diacylglycerol--glycerol-3-phosphate 3-phosphatidyltransferase [Mobiluncus curtisii]|uniref:CDP-diacylglycerol--glycerol-3-phosphate 3-phosphatidyltransferase n=1 Tax=Mobiluncus curtisii ATCC 51333 TaxID=887326 RepID=E6LYG3_9ACTO|nr:CDP-diacylglycerol--glycerol-3-phosphate 3-phosphatidyltransferase [Mobiluncus curtisii]EFU80206.1 CDP-diacylglycerol--glycerol-3-phosphate 3-phosphatidyltransferase [Mobiluncus curtisii ATCC 51333]
MTANLQGAPQPPAPPNFNIANVLTVIRLILVPVFIWLMLLPGVKAQVWAFAVFAVASATDKLDGTLARRLNLVTDFGKLADPIADKALVLSAFILLSLHWSVFWAVTIPVLVRELGITLMRLVLARRGRVMPASRGGKLKTVTQIALILLLLIPWEALVPTAWSVVRIVAIVLSVLVVVITVFTGVDYVRQAKHPAAERKPRP